MTACSPMKTEVEALLGVLDEDIRHVEAVLLQLDTLRALLIKRDDKGLEGLLDAIHRRADCYAANEQKRQALRRELAAHLGCSPSALTLSTLKRQLPEHTRSAVAERQVRLQTLLQQLQREHTLTTFLIADCTRFNRSLVRAIFGQSGSGAMTYGSTGAARAPAGAALMSLRL
jgi:hypothetical protein